MTIAESLLILMLGLPRPYDTEPQPAYADRLQTIALAIEAETVDVPGWRWGQHALAAAVLVVAYNESRFARDVHAGERFGDTGRRSACLMQIQSSPLVPLNTWRTIVGVDLAATRACIRAGITVLSYSARRCAGRATQLTRAHMARILGLYGSGKGCRPYPSAERRAASWARVVGKLSRRPSPSAYARAN
jgi:hypothetical protein